MNHTDLIQLFSIQSFLHAVKKLFPINIKNRLATNIIGLYHLLGASFILWGIFLPPKYLYIHIFLTSFMLFTYQMFQDKCFVTMISDFLCEEKSTDPLIIPIRRFKNIIFIILELSIISFFIPELSLFNILFV
tara:strand:+ start:474 stop:872 length:399 start_codon:yes stop_codon:yes gene_type:complete